MHRKLKELHLIPPVDPIQIPLIKYLRIFTPDVNEMLVKMSQASVPR